MLARYVEDRAQLEDLRAALPGVELFVVRLVAPQEVIEQRLRARDRGAQLAEHLAETAVFAARGEANALEDAVVENGERPLAEVAADVLTPRAGCSTPSRSRLRAAGTIVTRYRAVMDARKSLLSTTVRSSRGASSLAERS